MTEPYDDGEQFKCPMCDEMRPHHDDDLVICDVRVGFECVTPDLERLARCVERNYNQVVNQRNILREAIKERADSADMDEVTRRVMEGI